MPRLQGIRGEDATFWVALERFVHSQCVAQCGKQILRAHPDSSARGDLGTAAERVLDPRRLLQISVDFSHCKMETCMCLSRHSCREVAARPQHCPVPLTAPGSPPAPNDSPLCHHPCPLYPSKPTIISLLFSSPLLLHPSGSPQYTWALPFPSLLSFLLTHAISSKSCN